jgi:hypothetical protein
MNAQPKRKSRRFTPTGWSERLVPILIGVILVGLVAVLAIVALSLLGLTPGA